MEETFRPEERLVVHCLRPGDASERAISGLLERSLDWEVVVRTAERHGVSSRVSRTLGRFPEVVPEDVLESLRRRSRAVAQRNLRMTRELASLSEAFETRSIRAIPYRGPVLAALAYGDVGRREFGDLDFLCPHADLSRARSVLLDRGYEPRYILDGTDGLTDGQRWAYVRFARDYPFSHATEPFEVELHWRVVSQHFPTAIDLETVWNRRTTLSIAGREVPVLSPEDRLLMCCVHGTRHRWERLQWICDVAECLHRHSFDWGAIERRAKTHHCERMVYLGLAVAEDVLDAPLPDRVRRSIRADRAIGPLCRHVRERLFDGAEYPYLDLRKYQSRTLERRRDKARFWTYWALKPDRGDIETVPLPRWLAPLYGGVRLLRLAGGAVGKLAVSAGASTRALRRANE